MWDASTGVGPHLGSEPVNPGPVKQSVWNFNHSATGLAPKHLFLVVLEAEKSNVKVLVSF
ncbi:hypothetical protein TUM15759_20560 [Neisseria gonorrhoeae]|nr:hypothetical protein TUM15759_20560 [Neisseria gonorrhoeae]